MIPVSVSIIVPVYNVEPYIKECFDSVACQTYSGPLECIFVDDCGTDDSMGILDSCIWAYKGKVEFRIIHHERNRGLSAARNTGLGGAKGDYVFFLDSDDTITSDCIQKLVCHVIKHPGVDMVCGSTFREGKKWLDLKHKWWLPDYSCSPKLIKATMLHRSFIPAIACNKFFKRELIAKYDLHFEEGIVHEDELWNFFVAKHIGSIALERDITYLYRCTPESIIAKSISPMRYAPVVKVMLNNLSQPCIVAEVLCVLSFVESPDYDKLLKPIFEKYRFTRKVFDARLRTLDYSIFTVKGFFLQLAYRWWMLVVYFANKNILP